jgi:hypothetical protein
MWIRMDDGFDENPKQLRLSDAAFRVWVTSWSYTARLPRSAERVMTAEQARGHVRKLGKPFVKVTRELVNANAWESVPGGYHVHDIEEYLGRTSADRMADMRARRSSEEGGNPSPARNEGVTTPATAASPTRHEARHDRVTPRAGARLGIPSPSPLPERDTPLSGTDVPDIPPGESPGAVTLATVEGRFGAEYDAFVVELNRTTGRHFRGDAESRKKYAVIRRKGRSVEDLLAAARGVATSKHHMGINSSDMPYNAPINILRSKVLDQLIARGRGEIGIVRQATREEEQQAAVQAWAEGRSHQQREVMR